MDAIKGSSFSITGTAYTDWTGDTSSSTLANLTGATGFLYLKVRDDDADPGITAPIAITILDPIAATYQADVAAAITNNLSYLTLVMEVVVKLSNGKYIRNGVGTLNLKPNVLNILF